MEVKKKFVTPNNNDILCGRGRTVFNHPGNKKFRLKIAQTLDEYNICGSRQDRTKIIRHVIRYFMEEQGGRFLKYDNISKKWYDGGIKSAKIRVSTAFRDARIPNKVKCMEALRKSYGISANAVSNNHDNRQESSATSSISLRYKSSFDSPNSTDDEDVVNKGRKKRGINLVFKSNHPSLSKTTNGNSIIDILSHNGEEEYKSGNIRVKEEYNNDDCIIMDTPTTNFYSTSDDREDSNTPMRIQRQSKEYVNLHKERKKDKQQDRQLPLHKQPLQRSFSSPKTSNQQQQQTSAISPKITLQNSSLPQIDSGKEYDTSHFNACRTLVSLSKTLVSTSRIDPIPFPSSFFNNSFSASNKDYSSDKDNIASTCSQGTDSIFDKFDMIHSDTYTVDSSNSVDKVLSKNVDNPVIMKGIHSSKNRHSLEGTVITLNATINARCA